MATMDDLIEEMLAENKPWYILDEPIPEDVAIHLPRLLRPQRQFIDLDYQVQTPIQPPIDEWVEALNNANDKSAVDGITAVFSTLRVEDKDPIKIKEH